MPVTPHDGECIHRLRALGKHNGLGGHNILMCRDIRTLQRAGMPS